MNKDLQDYYEAQFDMFQSKGWKDLIEHITSAKMSTNDLKNIETSDNFWYKKGENAFMDWIIGWQEMVEVAYKQNMEE